MSYAFVHFVYVPLTDGGNDRQRACTCHFFTVSGSLIPQTKENKSITKERKIRNILCYNTFAISSRFANIS